MGSVRIGVDIGGTFTDVTVLDADSGRVSIGKVPSRRGDPGAALIDAVECGLEVAGCDPADVDLLVHGTTIVTNAVLENKLPPSSLITTEGFRDVLEIGRHFRPDMYDLQQDKAAPIVPRHHRFELAERVSSGGEILVEPERKEFARLLDSIRASNVQAVAICFLNSFVNPENEEKVKTWLQEELPEHYISASYDVCREMREYERMSTVTLNAAAMPLVARYLGEIAPRVREVLPNAYTLIMQSNGGSLTVQAAKSYPARLITSGPAGGALAVQRMSRATNYPNLLGVDMGGTSTDISFIQKGELRMTTEAEVAARPIKLPMIEINTIGAGAGSIAWLDSANGLHVGPHSAGSDPGPVAYGNGGTEPTVTDANLVLGRLLPERFASGRIKLDIEASKRAIMEKIGKPLGMTLEEAASGIVQVANANMERAVRVSSAERGDDPRQITLVAFGGAGPMHAAALAQAAGMPTVLVPGNPGVFSALGLVMSDIRHDFVQTRILRGKEITVANLAPIYDEMSAQAVQALEDDGISEERRSTYLTADLRYVGQAYEVNVSLGEGGLSDESLAAMIDKFHEQHLQLFAHNHPGREVEFVSARLTAIGAMAAPAILPGEAKTGSASPKLHHPVYFSEVGDYQETPVYDRLDLLPGFESTGPAIVEQVDATTVVHPGQPFSIDPYGNILISIAS